MDGHRACPPTTPSPPTTTFQASPQSLLRFLTSPSTSHFSCRLPSPPAPSSPAGRRALQSNTTSTCELYVAGRRPPPILPLRRSASAQCSRRRAPFCPRPLHRCPHYSKHHRPRQPAQGGARPDPTRGYSRCHHQHAQQTEIPLRPPPFSTPTLPLGLLVQGFRKSPPILHLRRTCRPLHALPLVDRAGREGQGRWMGCDGSPGILRLGVTAWMGAAWMGVDIMGKCRPR